MSSESNYKPVKVIGAGWGRTGTSSFKKAMDILNLGPCYHMVEVFANKDAAFWTSAAYGEKVDMNKIFRGKYQSSCDVPSCIFWKEQLAQFPDAKVVLTYRDPESWYKSVIETIYHFQPGGPYCSLGVKLAFMYGLPTPGFRKMMEKLIDLDAYNYNYDKENVINHYKKRCQSIIDECPKDKLLVFKATDGWEPLCKFLNVPVPDVPYPHENDTAHFKKIILGVTIAGYAITAVLAGATYGLCYLAWSKYGFKLGKEL